MPRKALRQVDTAPPCPECGGKTRIVFASTGEAWRCRDYPKCRGTVGDRVPVKVSSKEKKTKAPAFLKRPTLRVAFVAFNKHIAMEADRRLQRPNIQVEGSEEQNQIWKHLKEQSNHMVVNALAGTGKTFTMEQGCRKITSAGLVEARTYHSLGNSAVRRAFPNTEIDGDKLKKIIAGFEMPAYESPWSWNGICFAAKRLSSYAKHYLISAPDDLEHIADHHDVDLSGSKRKALDLVPLILEKCKQTAGEMIDYDDQVWLPTALQLPFEGSFDVLIGDENQDSNRCQQELTMMACPKGRVVIIGDKNQCQPKGTLVYRTGFGYTPIEKLRPNDEVLTYVNGGFPGRNKSGRKIVALSRQKYTGEMIRISAGKFTHDATPNHRCFVRMEKRNGWAVYVCEKDGHARVGVTKSAKNPAQSVALRSRQEHAQKSWILGIFEKRDEAYLLESQVAYNYNLPQLCFKRKWKVEPETIHTQGWIDQFWFSFPKNIEKLKTCLSDHGRYYEHPFWWSCKNGGEAGAKRGSLYAFTTQACNLLSGWMRVCTYNNSRSARKSDWKCVTLERYPYTGTVYSLELDHRWRGEPTYVAQGILTHNSIYGFRGADITAMETMTERLRNTPKGASEFPLTITRRCPKSHVALAQAIVPEIRAMDDAPEGVVEDHPEPRAIDLMQPGDLVLCRINKPLVSAAYSLIRRGVRPYVLGRNFGDGIMELVDKLEKLGKHTISTLPELASILRDYEQKEEQKLIELGDKGEGRLSRLREKCDCLAEMITQSESVQDLKLKIATLFKDFDSSGAPKGVVLLGTVHKTKGLEAERVFVLSPELLPHPMAKQAWKIQQEKNLAYVAVTRAKYNRSTDAPGTLIFCGDVPRIYERKRI